MSAADEEQEVRPGYDPLGDSPSNYRREPVGVHPPLDFPAYK